jgi:hypothetical protein
VNVCIDTIDCWGERCYILELEHRRVSLPNEPNWEERFRLGVDSGTMSVIDDAYYRRKNGSSEDFESDEKE